MPDKTPAAPKHGAADGITVAATMPVRRHPGHRGTDVRDTVAEMAAKAQEISMEAGSKMAAAMKDVINAAAGLTSFAIESSRDLVQYMVRRGQMTQDEADKLIREAEDAWSKKHKGKKPPARGPASTPSPKLSSKLSSVSSSFISQARLVQGDAPGPPAKPKLEEQASNKPPHRATKKAQAKSARRPPAKKGKHASKKPAAKK